MHSLASFQPASSKVRLSGTCCSPLSSRLLMLLAWASLVAGWQHWQPTRPGVLLIHRAAETVRDTLDRGCMSHGSADLEDIGSLWRSPAQRRCQGRRWLATTAFVDVVRDAMRCQVGSSGTWRSRHCRQALRRRREGVCNATTI